MSLPPSDVRPTDRPLAPQHSQSRPESRRPSRPASRPASRPDAPTRRRTALRLARNLGVPLLLAGLVTAGSPGWGLYTIERGDTLSDIAARYGTTV
ncbi:MAG TPA: LysM domain-containing protein, partial [Actinomycetes bacterium]|nr:LysM domain-containing protein [Actinomycetes bacterium]